jgi:hypothetical protein
MTAANAVNAKRYSYSRAVLMALVLVGASSSFLATPAKADNDDRWRDGRERRVVVREHRDRDWRERRGDYYEARPYTYYAPPPVVYYPPPRSPSIDFVFPIHIR